MSSFVMQWASKLGRRGPLEPRQFTNTNFATINKSEIIEEETIPGYVATHYYPMKIGEVFGLRYQVVGKLGFGSFSTVWLARNLKGFTQSKKLGVNVDHEIMMYEQLSRGSRFHPGRASVRTALDNVKHSGPNGEHQCLVHKLLWDSVQTLELWLVIWDIFEDKHMFYGTDPEYNTYRSRAHLAEMVTLLGPPPADLISRGKLGSRFFSLDEVFQGGIELPPTTSLEKSEDNLKGEDKKLSLQFMRSMLQWRPEARETSRELLKDPWLNQQ